MLRYRRIRERLDRNAKKVPNRHCGRFAGWALKAGGLNIGSHNGRDYGPYLQDNGFSTVSSDGYTPQTGDVAVFQNYPDKRAKQVTFKDGMDVTGSPTSCNQIQEDIREGRLESILAGLIEVRRSLTSSIGPHCAPRPALMNTQS